MIISKNRTFNVGLVPQPVRTLRGEDAARSAKELLKYRRGMGDWLACSRWAHLVTLTFATPRTPPVTARLFASFVRQLEQRSQRRVDWFRVTEQGLYGRAHIHALLAGTEILTEDDLHNAWKHGRTSIEQYNPERAGTHYISKFLGRESTDYDVSAKWPSVDDRNH